MLSWTLTSIMLIEVCRAWVVALGLLHVLWALHAMTMGLNPGMSTPGSTDNFSGCFPHENNLSHCKMMDRRLFGNGLITILRLTGNNSCFSRDDIFPFGVVLTHWKVHQPKTAFTHLEYNYTEFLYTDSSQMFNAAITNCLQKWSTLATHLLLN